ncbi:hypothetical protein PSEUDO8Z_160367 [Pseudomonas sp. 8Z]|uniref:helix-turn-helix domain-containing protein n=1 Tax=Pseudomonas sp. 8Z TaxID=2653166 RepID=UPI0012EFF13F|nr:helix-turn-helix domain-containing protein [Pseudomonas sp. 8Z]VXC72755.1 hypothetical protein PSEUDO8Z_160367 [Pseudomonas sp. 8Z]
MSIGARLKEERERLGLTISEFAEIAGAKKNTVIDWQKDVSGPPAAKLAALAAVGIDVMYVLTGQRSQQSPTAELPPRQRALLDNYSHLSEEDQAALERTASALAQSVGQTVGRKSTG